MDDYLVDVQIERNVVEIVGRLDSMDAVVYWSRMYMQTNKIVNYVRTKEIYLLMAS